VLRGGSNRHPLDATQRVLADGANASAGRQAGFRCAADSVAGTWSDELDDPATGWPQLAGKHITTGYVPPSGYEMTLEGAGQRATIPTGIAASDLDASLGIQLDADSTGRGIRYGLAFRDSDRGGYRFGLDLDHSRWVLERVRDGAVKRVAAGPAGTLGGRAVPDTLRVSARGATIDLFLNGRLVQRVTDRTYDAGGIGVFVDTGKADTATVLVDRIATRTDGGALDW
jgi:hypothetical protein